MPLKRRHLSRVALAGLFLLSSCALVEEDSQKSFVKECNLPPDQSDTLMGFWPSIPIPIALHQNASGNDFDADQTAAILAGASSWNSFFVVSKGTPVINTGTGTDDVKATPGTGDGGTTSSPTPAVGKERISLQANQNLSGQLCGSGLSIVNQSQFTGNVVIYKVKPWTHTNLSRTIALTTFCFANPKRPTKNFMAVIEINFDGFFGQNKRNPDLQSIVTHEFGHMIGLDHSCEVPGRTGMANCNNPDTDPIYRAQSMFFTFSFDVTTLAGEVRRNLGTNDQSRANCLYKGEN